MIAIVDYDMGNLRSVEKAVHCVGGEAVISSDPQVVAGAEKIILPGVGAFPDGMKNLKRLGLHDILIEQIRERHKPFLGICLGMQLLAKKSFEFGEFEGLNLINAEVVRFEFNDPSIKIPHVGWNEIQVIRSNSLLRQNQSGDTFYFVHSYHMKVSDPNDVSAVCHYGYDFTAAIKRDNIFATQFHPEKSQENGLNILASFVTWKGN